MIDSLTELLSDTYLGGWRGDSRRRPRYNLPSVSPPSLLSLDVKHLVIIAQPTFGIDLERHAIKPQGEEVWPVFSIIDFDPVVPSR